MAGHALKRVTSSRWITKICGHSNLIHSEFHHISSRLSYKAAPCSLFFGKTVRKVAGVVERAALEMR